ncbi:replication-relaxation family protein [Tissierella praeacuta]|uniref:replication-relaxation family protein n=1 Tax=Tissierella praeacuta TaxID=43131 RepID=UPI0028A91340|nr:replication-relaxation family protein [Tissierella praeacuta]
MRWLTGRDKKIIKFIYFHRFVSTKQIIEIFFKYTEDGKEIKYPQNVARRRLLKYRNEGLIKSFYTSNTDMIHTIDEKGVFVVASILNTTFNKLYFNPKEDLISIGLANHSLVLNDLYIKLMNEAAKLGGAIRDYRVEALNRVSFIHRNKKYIFQPDVYMLYQPDVSKNVAFPYFIELDLDTESPKKYKEKIINYENYYDSKDYQNQYNIFPKIVTITNTKARADRLKNFCKTKLDWRYEVFEETGKILMIK